MAGHGWEDWFEREEFIGQISDMRVQNLQVEREVVQKRTFTRWINLHLEKSDPPIEVHDLFRDIQDGYILMALLEELSGCKLLHRFKKSSHRIFRLNNIAKVLSFLEERNVKLVSIDAADIADGNSSIILGLIWNIILFFQIKELTGNIRSQFPSSCSLSSIHTSSDSDTSFGSTPSDERQSAATSMREHSKAIKKLLQWVQKRTRKFGVAVQDFGKSWTSGLAFLAVIKSIDPSLVDMRKALLRTPKENLEEAFRIAHYSLGIPRLLDPEDVTINVPDEQSIITYVSQFLEHFPGLEELEEPCHVIERNISLCRLNFHDSDPDHIRDGAHGSRVKERSCRFQRDFGQPPPKILLSSLSEDKGTRSHSNRPATARSWSTEGFLMDSSQGGNISFTVTEDPREITSEVLVNPTLDSSQLIYTNSLTDSSLPEPVNTESVIGDSAISSPDSWVENDFSITPDKCCESRSDSSLCDSGTAWDVYRATPVEITTLDEGFFPSTEDSIPGEHSITESHTDEGIYSLTSLENIQEMIQVQYVNKQDEIVSEKETTLKNPNQNLPLEQITDRDRFTKEVNSQEMDTSVLRKEVLREQELSFGQCDGSGINDILADEKNNQSKIISNTYLPLLDHLEKLIKHTSLKENPSGEQECLKKTVDSTGDMQDHDRKTNDQTENLNDDDIYEVVEAKFHERATSSEETRLELSNKRDEGTVKTLDKTNEEYLREHSDLYHPANQDIVLKESPGPSTGMNIHLTSFSSEPEEQEDEETCDPERQDQTIYVDEEHQAEETVCTGSNTDANNPQNADEISCYTVDSDDKNHPKSPSCIVSENEKTTYELTADSRYLDEKDEHAISSSAIAGTKVNQDGSEVKWECEFPEHNSQDSIFRTSSTDDRYHPLDTDVAGNLHHQHKLSDMFSNIATTEQNTFNSFPTKHNGVAGMSCPEDRSREIDFSHTDFGENSLTDELLGDPIEPMDIFYPDKEEVICTEPPDTEMQRWPSVLSVTALQPAPVSQNLQNDQPLYLLGQDFSKGVDVIQDNGKVITNTNQEAGEAPESKKQCFLVGESTGLLGGGISSEYEAKQHFSASKNTEPMRSDTKSTNRHDEIQIPPVLRHRKGLHFTQSTDHQSAATRQADSEDSDMCDSSDLYLLLLFWLLLYCFWLLPQMDMKTLPRLLLNL